MVAMLVSEAVEPIGPRVKVLREARGLTQEELADAAGVKRPWLGLLEIGRIRRPGAERIERLARALGVDSRYLLRGAPMMPTIKVDLPRDEAPVARRISERYGLQGFSLAERLLAVALTDIDQLRREAAEGEGGPDTDDDTPQQQAEAG